MDYEKLYKESLERAKNLRKDAIDMGDNIRAKQCEIIFPILKDSENERIRGALIDFFNKGAENGEQTNGVYDKDILVWLEKQGHTDSIIEKAKTEKQRVIISETDGDANIDWDTRSLEDTKRLLECGLQYINRELEKQGEQKSKNESTETCDSLIITSKEFPASEKRDFGYFSEPTDKIEPKFHEGDWIVDNCGNVWKIEGILNQFYILECVEGGESRPTIEWVDKTFRLWAIEDARYGDILCGDTSEVILMFRGIGNSRWVDVIDYYCYYDCHRKCLIVQKGLNYWGNTKNCQLKPATKEQRDLLFQKIKEVGYEWDSDKKELKEIEKEPNPDDIIEESYQQQADGLIDMAKEKSVWSEEDEKLFDLLHSCICSCISDPYWTYQEREKVSKEIIPFIERLKSLKQRIV